jgi:hypothetical protein
MLLTAGILDLVVGVPTLAFGILLVGSIEPWIWWASSFYRPGAITGGVLVTLAMIAIIGGISALRKRLWGLSLAGSICALFATLFLIFLLWPSPAQLFLLLSVPAVVFTVLGKMRPEHGTKEVRSTWMPLTAGILDLVVGVPILLFGILLAGGIDPIFWWTSLYEPGAKTGAVLITLAVIAITGGVFALRERAWGLALAGSICALFANLFLIFLLWPSQEYLLLLPVSVPAVVFTILGGKHFERGRLDKRIVTLLMLAIVAALIFLVVNIYNSSQL